MAVKKSRKPPSFVIYSYLKGSASTSIKIKGMESCTVWVCELGTICQIKAYVRGIFFVKNGIQKGKGLDQSGPSLRVDKRQ